MIKDTQKMKRRLFGKLKEFYSDKDFVCGVVSNTRNDDDRQAIIDYLGNESDVSIESIILLSLHLKNKRNISVDKEFGL